MRKITYILALAIVSGTFNACSPWEDESYHPGNDFGPTMLLKEMTTTYHDSNIVSKQVFEYDSEDRLKKITTHSDTSILESYSVADYTYPNAMSSKISTKTYLNGDLFSEALTESSYDGNEMNIVMSMNGEEMLTAVATIGLPCGIDTMNQSFNFLGQTITSVSTYQYTDSNCSFRHMVDGELFETVTNDNKRNPMFNEQAYLIGYASHNPLKVVDHDEGTVQEYTYIYNESNYPVSAEITLKTAEGELIEEYTVSYTYY